MGLVSLNHQVKAKRSQNHKFLIAIKFNFRKKLSRTKKIKKVNVRKNNNQWMLRKKFQRQKVHKEDLYLIISRRGAVINSKIILTL